VIEMSIQMKASFINYKDIDVEVSIRMPMADWKRLKEQMRADIHPSSEIYFKIYSVIEKLETQVQDFTP
jgi:hypothetical protein